MSSLISILRRSVCNRLARALFCPGICLCAAGAAAAQEGAPPAVTAVSQFWTVPPAGKTLPHPLDLELLVHYYDPDWTLLWGSAGGSWGFVPLAPQRLPFRSGQRVRLTGTVVPATGLEADKIQTEILAEAGPPQPLDVADRPVEPHALNGRLVAIEGYVNGQVEVDRHHLLLHLAVGDRTVSGRLWLEQDDILPQLQGQFIRATGVWSVRDETPGDTPDVDLWIPALANVVSLGRLEDDRRFTTEATRIDAIPAAAPDTLLRVVGLVQTQEPGQQLTIRDDTGQVVLHSHQKTSLAIGDLIEAIGYRTADEAGGLARGFFRPLARHSDPAAPKPGNSPLRLAEQVMRLGVEEAARGYEVHLYGVVLWSDRNSDFLFLHDASGGVRIKHGRRRPPPPGIAIEVAGTTAAGEFAPGVDATRVRRHGVADVPEAKVVTLEQALTGVEEARWIELRGVLRAVVEESGATRLDLGTSAGQFVARLPAGSEVAALRGSVLRLRGVCSAIANQRRQMTGVQLWVPSLEFVHVEVPAPQNPFQEPLHSLASLRQYDILPSLDRWVRVTGVVVHHEPGHSLFVQQDAEGMTILSREDEPLQPGDEIEAVGLPGREGARVVLREAVYRRTGLAPQPTPLRIDPDRAIDEDLDSRLVVVTGTVVEAASHRGGSHVVLRTPAGVFTARLGAEFPPQLAAAVVPGSELALTGVYQIEVDEYRQPAGFHLHLRTPGDITVLQRPPWLTPRRALAGFGILAASAALGFGWVGALRRRVARQTERIRAQVTKEAHLEERNRSLVANASDFIFTTDREGRFTSFNAAGERLTGYPRSEALQMHLRDLFTAPSPAHNLTLSEVEHAEGGRVSFHAELRTRDGRQIWVETNASAVQEDGGTVGILAVVRDISERRQAEAELTRARDAAEANTRAKSAFLANMSHELRTPMNGVIGMSHLLLDTGLDREQREFADIIRRSAESLMVVLNDILDFSKIEAGKLPLDRRDLDVRDLVDDVLDLLAPNAAAKGLELAALVAPDVPLRVQGDHARVRQILLNLLGNAVKFTERGEVVVTLSTAPAAAGGRGIRFEVRDTGVGIQPDARARLFKPFSQLDDSATRRFGGTGLGLAISKQLVELMGGAIGVDSEVGRGTSFWFTIPFGPAETEQQAAQDEAEAALSRPRVLLVVAHPLRQRALAQLLASWKARTETAPDAARAAAALRTAAAARDPFRLLLVDQELAGTEGDAWVPAARDAGDLAGATAVLVNPAHRQLAREKLPPLGFADMLAAPVRRSRLRPLLQQSVLAEIPLPLVAGSPSEDAGAAPDSPDKTGAPSLPETSAPAPAARDEAPGSPATELSALRVLVADDHAINQRLTQLNLRKLGIEPAVVANGLEVLQALEQAEFDVILMDCQMPEMDGFEATRRLRRGDRCPTVHVIAMTASAMPGDRERCLDAGMNDYLSKPTRLDELRAALERVQYQRSGASQAAHRS